MKTIKRRKAEAKTDYKRRLQLLKSSKLRAVVRKTNRYIIAQIIESGEAQDRVIAGTTSKELLAYGWPKENSGSLKSIGAAYLTGFLLGKKASGKTKEAILDIGMNRNVKKSRIYAALKGLLDSGIQVTHSKEVLPTDEDLRKNEKVGKLVSVIKGEINQKLREAGV